MLKNMLSLTVLSVCCVLFIAVNGQQLNETLRAAAAQRGIYVGAAMNYGYMNSNSAYRKMGGQQYNLVTAENGCKWSATEPEYNQFDFTQCDYVYNFSVEYNMAFRGHNLCWGEYNPSWLTSGNYNQQQLEQILQTHITTVMNRYGTNALGWDVVNEAVSDNPSPGNIYKENVWYPTIPNYVELAFTYARQAQPNVLLFYNDYNILDQNSWESLKSDTVYNMTVELASKGLIDGIGIQSHLDIQWYPMDTDLIKSNFQRYKDLGLYIHITELDITLQSQSQFDEEGEMYQQLLEICLEFDNCVNFETWGYTDEYTWKGSNTYPLPFDTNLNPKPAAFDILSTLQG